jgi:hypothetical protein
MGPSESMIGGSSGKFAKPNLGSGKNTKSEFLTLMISFLLESRV